MAEDSPLKNCFRSYIEFNEKSQRIVIREVVSKNAEFVRFGLILKKFKEVSGDQDIGFQFHRFWILNQNKRKLIEIRRYDHRIPNASKIVVSAKPDSSGKTTAPLKTEFKSIKKKSMSRRRHKPRIAVRLDLIEVIDTLSKSRVLPFKWSTVSEAMRFIGHDFCKTQCLRQFQTLFRQLTNYLTNDSIDGKRVQPIGDKTLELFRRVVSLDLKRFVSKESLRLVEDNKSRLEVEETLNWLLIQTSKASMDWDYRTETVPSSDKPFERRTDDRNTDSKTNNGVKGFNRRQIFDSIDAKLVSVIHKLEANGREYYDWPTIRQEMSAGADFFDTRLLKDRFERLIDKYMTLLGRIYIEEDAINEWPLFEKISKLDLRPFCDQMTYQTIKRLKAEISSELDTISVETYSQNKSHYYNYIKNSKFAPNY